MTRSYLDTLQELHVVYVAIVVFETFELEQKFLHFFLGHVVRLEHLYEFLDGDVLVVVLGNESEGILDVVDGVVVQFDLEYLLEFFEVDLLLGAVDEQFAVDLVELGLIDFEVDQQEQFIQLFLVDLGVALFLLEALLPAVALGDDVENGLEGLVVETFYF